MGGCITACEFKRVVFRSFPEDCKGGFRYMFAMYVLVKIWNVLEHNAVKEIH
jgi:hypothetical protein